MSIRDSIIDRWKGFWADPELSHFKILSLILALYVLYLMLSMKDIIQEHNMVFATNWKTYHCWIEGNPDYQKLAGINMSNYTMHNLTIINTSDLNFSIGRILTQ